MELLENPVPLEMYQLITVRKGIILTERILPGSCDINHHHQQQLNNGGNVPTIDPTIKEPQ
jgi:hypothetical protein